MRTIEYSVTYQTLDVNVYDRVESERFRVQARDINAGYAKVLKLAREPLGNGVKREIARVEFWQVCD